MAARKSSSTGEEQESGFDIEAIEQSLSARTNLQNIRIDSSTISTSISVVMKYSPVAFVLTFLLSSVEITGKNAIFKKFSNEDRFSFFLFSFSLTSYDGNLEEVSNGTSSLDVILNPRTLKRLVFQEPLHEHLKLLKLPRHLVVRAGPTWARFFPKVEDFFVLPVQNFPREARLAHIHGLQVALKLLHELFHGVSAVNFVFEQPEVL
ncbi:fibronectin type III domain protein [Striga asiatica]|uniref:Fibronectin type III domain protein n=1 Tax=Striga asiatica TaxID=4170 RepID=A0A5A7QZE2_STRAF|nr:fibronectin type III domain protein [Striga asiatica]